MSTTMTSALRLLALAVVIAAAFCQGALAQPNLPNDAPVARANAGTVGVISGGIDGTYVRIAADLGLGNLPRTDDQALPDVRDGRGPV